MQNPYPQQINMIQPISTTRPVNSYTTIWSKQF